MREYIVNLTNNLIGEHQFDSMMANLTNEGEFILQASRELLIQNVSRMSPETLGRILCELDGADINPGVHFELSVNKKCERSMRILVSGLLAQSIYNRLSGRIPFGYTRRGTVSPEFKALIGQFVQRRQNCLSGLKSGSSMLKITYQGKQLTCVYLRHTKDTVTVQATKEIVDHLFNNGTLRLSGPFTDMPVNFKLNEVRIANG